MRLCEGTPPPRTPPFRHSRPPSSFPHPPSVIPAPLPSFPRKRESRGGRGWVPSPSPSPSPPCHQPIPRTGHVPYNCHNTPAKGDPCPTPIPPPPHPRTPPPSFPRRRESTGRGGVPISPPSPPHQSNPNTAPKLPPRPPKQTTNHFRTPQLQNTEKNAWTILLGDNNQSRPPSVIPASPFRHSRESGNPPGGAASPSPSPPSVDRGEGGVVRLGCLAGSSWE